MKFKNAYEDEKLAEAYARLQFPGTYYLAYRDLPETIFQHVTGRRALDFGCGAGRSTRFLRDLGFEVVGIDVSERMLSQARAMDPAGEYRLISDGDLGQVGQVFHLISSLFTFDNVPTRARKVEIFRRLTQRLAPGGRILNLVSSPEIYVNEWTSFSTAEFPENRSARTGDIVRIINNAIDDRRPVEDVLWTDDAWRDVFTAAGLQVVQTYRPLGREDEPYPWVNETRIAPWVIYVLKNAEEDRE